VIDFETPYGMKKRFLYLTLVIKRLFPKKVLDVGCGTGSRLTIPLAEQFPDISFVGFDIDKEGIKFAQRKNKLSNLSFVYGDNFKEKNFDLIIASEVIEHVEQPIEFLIMLKGKISKKGKIVVTLPNGYGPFEFLTLFYVLLNLAGIYQILRSIKRKFRKDFTPSGKASKYSLANSCHVNFFSFRKFIRMIKNTGFEIIEFRPRTFLCGFGIDQVMLYREKLINYNSKLADRLPPQIVSGWMFLLSPTNDKEVRSTSYKRSLYERFKKYIYQKFWE